MTIKGFVICLVLCGPMALLAQYHDPTTPTLVIVVALVLAMIGVWIFARSVMLCLIVAVVSLGMFANAVTYGHL